MADPKSDAKQVLLLFCEEVAAVVTTLLLDNVEAVGKERSCGMVKPRAAEDHDRNSINAS
jgi:hypothetical protein